jgi:hypothetical protein
VRLSRRGWSSTVTAAWAALRRADFQDELTRLNASWVDLHAVALPDGDAEVDHMDLSLSEI